MEQNEIGQQGGNKNLILIIVSVLATALVVGGGVYAFQRSQQATSQQNLQSQIDTLKSQLASANAVTPAPSAVPASSQVPTLTPTPSATPVKATKSPNNGWEAYVSADEKFKVNYPPTWKPYVNNNPSGNALSVSFTSPKRLADTSQGSGGFQAFYDFQITAVKSATDLPGGSNPATLADWIAHNSSFTYSGTMVKVGGMNAYKGMYTQDGTPAYIVQGSSFIYEISPYETDSDGQQADGSQMLSSITFL